CCGRPTSSSISTATSTQPSINSAKRWALCGGPWFIETLRRGYRLWPGDLRRARDRRRRLRRRARVEDPSSSTAPTSNVEAARDRVSRSASLPAQASPRRRWLQRTLTTATAVSGLAAAAVVAFEMLGLRL